MHPVSLFEHLVETAAGVPVALATVLQVGGSVPRRPGAMQALAADGRELGTVGGGAMEARILELMRTIVRSSSHGSAAADVHHVTIDLGGSVEDVRDGICGGSMLVEVRHLSGDDLGELAGAVASLRRGRSVEVRATREGVTVADAGTDADADEGTGGVRDAFGASAAGDAWSLRLDPRPLLLVVGGGHCGEALAHQCDRLDFDVVIEDDRAEVRRRLVVPPRVRVVAGPTGRTLDELSPARELHVALVTRSFRQDLAALAALRERGHPAGFVGVMGSGRRLGTVFSLLREQGWARGDLQRLDAPIGLDIGAETPAEIAVAVAGRLIAWRRGRRLTAAGDREVGTEPGHPTSCPSAGPP